MMRMIQFFRLESRLLDLLCIKANTFRSSCVKGSPFTVTWCAQLSRHCAAAAAAAAASAVEASEPCWSNKILTKAGT